MSTEVIVVTSWKGIDRRGPGVVKSQRNQLDVPRMLTNFIVDDNGHLYMPPAVTETVHTFTGEGSILCMRATENPSGILVQTEQKVHFIPRGSTTPQTLVTPTNPAWKIWCINTPREFYFGYGSRGTGAGSQTWKGVNDDGAVAVTTLSNQPDASYSTMYKGRRFTMYQGRHIQYSELNEPEEFLYDEGETDNEFPIGGDDRGNSQVTNPGVVKGMVSWEDVLVIFLTGSVWTLTGGSPDHWDLRQNMTVAGNTSEWTIVPIDGGVLSYGGSNIKDEGFYLFTGNEARKISRELDDVISLWISGDSDVDREPRLEGTIGFNNYICGLGHSDEDAPQFVLWNLDTQAWTTFDGFVKGCFTPTAWGDYYADGLTVLFDDVSKTFKRKAGRSAKLTVGFEDGGIMGGLSRFLGVKLWGKKEGTGTPTVTVTATLPSGKQVVSPPVALTDDVFDGTVIPLNVRGAAIELTLEVTPDKDDDAVLLESMQLIRSLKGNKLSRA